MSDEVLDKHLRRYSEVKNKQSDYYSKSTMGTNSGHARAVNIQTLGEFETIWLHKIIRL